MRIEILVNGMVDNTIEADEAFAEEHHPGAWRLAEQQDEPPGQMVPQIVSRRQALKALVLAGLLDQVQPAIDAIQDPVQRQLAQIDWDTVQEFERGWPLLVQIGQGLGLGDADMDALFIQAGTL